MSEAFTFPVEGMRCAGCVSRVESVLKEQPGVDDVSVNLALNQAHVELEDGRSLCQLAKSLGEAGYPVPVERQQWMVSGMRCAGCSSAVEQAVSKIPGVMDADVNYALGQVFITSIASIQIDQSVVKAIENAGFQVEDPQPVKSEAPKASADFPWRLIVSLILTIPLVVPMLISILALPGYVQWLLATPVQFILGWPFYKGAWHAIRQRAGSMDILVALGTSAAYFYSVWLYLSGYSAHLYFDGAAVIITLILVGRYIEEKAKAKAARAISQLIQEAPLQAHRLNGDIAEDIAVDALRAGDWVLIKPGEKSPADGVIRWGSSEFNESLITGESRPVVHAVGDEILAGSLNGEGLLKVEVTRANAESTLGRMIQMVQNAQSGKAPVQKLADKISFYFVPAVLSVSLLTLLFWGLATGDWADGIAAAISVLVIACPCSLGLATPTALVAGTGSGAKFGILFRNIDALERTRNIDQVVFDKTGTLTQGRPQMTEVICDGSQEQLIRYVASAQQGSQHPLAQAMLEANNQTLIPLDHFNSYPGMGIEAHLNDEKHTRVLAGNRALMSHFQIVPGDIWLNRLNQSGESGSRVLIAIDDKIKGVIATCDSVRTQSKDAVNHLKSMGIDSVMLTGDQIPVARQLASDLQLAEWAAELKPEDKLVDIQLRQKAGQRVLMVGDGVNDAPALAQADVGIAMGSGSDLAIESADIALMRDDPLLVANAVALARQTWRVIQQNLFWAFCYNVIGIPLAAFGLLSPAIAGAAMAMSSLSVVSNSVRLTRWKPKQPEDIDENR
ncbi:MAG: Copper-exporting P-type ATPase [Candidatus Celerinatantimonas neptuna]|nr:MAG: Copper-exporting P-type ATPase [Candidatus Celerinatantimonas neptuna]